MPKKPESHKDENIQNKDKHGNDPSPPKGQIYHAAVDKNY